MTISFNTIPSNIRVPLFYAEVDNSQAGSFSQNQSILLIGQKLAAGTASTDTPEIVNSTDDAKTLYGLGSMLARMHSSVRQNDLAGEIWCIALADDGGAVAATGTITVTGPSTAAGTLTLYIAGQRITVTVASGDTATTIGAAITAAVTAATELPVTAADVAGVVTLTCRWAGATGNDITIIENYRGNLGGEKTPAGVSLAIVAMASGATDPALSAAITAMGEEEYDFIISPYSGTSQMDALRTEMDDSTGRWSYSRQIYGHVYTAARDTFSNLQTLGSARNDQHNTIAGYEVDTPNPVWEYAAAYGGRNAVYIKADPARPTQTGPLVGILPPRVGNRFILSERESLLNAGIATSVTRSGQVLIGRSITTYQTNSFGQPDTSYLDSETMHTSAYVVRQLRFAVTTKYARHKLRDDGQNFGAGQAIVTPNIVRGAMLDVYTQMEYLGIVENTELFNQNLVVERDVGDPNRINVLFPADYVNQLRVFALLNQFRLQYAEAA